MALVVLHMNPMQRAEMEGAVRAIVPHLGPDNGEKQRAGQRKQRRILEEAEIQEDAEDHRVDRRVNGILQLSLDLLRADGQVVDGPLANPPFVPGGKIPEQRHRVPKRRYHEELDKFPQRDHRMPLTRSRSLIACAFTNRFTYPLRLLSLVNRSPFLSRSIIIG